MDSDSLWKAFGHIVTAAVKHGEKQPGRDGDRRGGGAPGSFGEAAPGTLRVKLGTSTTTPCCIARRKGQK